MAYARTTRRRRRAHGLGDDPVATAALATQCPPGYTWYPNLVYQGTVGNCAPPDAAAQGLANGVFTGDLSMIPNTGVAAALSSLWSSVAGAVTGGATAVQAAASDPTTGMSIVRRSAGELGWMMPAMLLGGAAALAYVFLKKPTAAKAP